MKVSAPAKINLHLSVGTRRSDGYHEVLSVMQAVSVYDTLSLSATESGFALDVSGDAPEDESNLVVRATRAMWGTLGRTPGVAIALEKTIPVAAGLAGGSADAAATLVGLNRLWDAGLSRKALEKIGASIGSDVPFCVRGGTAIARGRGEVLSPLPVRKPLWWVIAVPDATLSTPEVFAQYPGGMIIEPLELVNALAQGDVDAAGAALHNDLADAGIGMVPSIGSLCERLRAAGAVAAVMSGSGPSVAALCRDETHASQVLERVDAPFAAVASSIDHGPRIT